MTKITDLFAKVIENAKLHTDEHNNNSTSHTYLIFFCFTHSHKLGTGNLDLLNQLDLIGRTCELAKLFGIQFYEVLSRGSQYRVESMMLRYALLLKSFFRLNNKALYIVE